ncbi:MAG TPA: adenylosuccinate lyase [Firmicutes bacterium]|jgi:3-carboxy-cis,cis-muconate cycloisomerase|nr:adenylosuccinate lyase [Bacillota bacterium]
MSASVIESSLFKDIFGTDEMRKIWDDLNTVQKWLDVEAALARAQAKLGIIPAAYANEISKKARVELIDMDELKRGIDKTTHPLMPLVRVFRTVCAGDAGEFIHWGATTQDIMDTGLVLQIKESLELVEPCLSAVNKTLKHMASEHKDTVMAGRTHGQHALPITFGYKVAVWQKEIARHLTRLEQVKKRVLIGQFGGAVGTLASMGFGGLEVQELMFRELGLEVPDIAWHASRDSLAELVCVLGMISATLGKIANEVVTLQKTEYGELEEPFEMGMVGSSTMPHKRNPMTSESVVAISKMVRYNVPLAIEAMVGEFERDMRTWQTEWKFVGESFILLSGAIRSINRVLQRLYVNVGQMRSNVYMTKGLILSEAIMLKLGEKIGRQKAHDLVYKICMKAYEEDMPLQDALMQEPSILGELTPQEIEVIMDPVSYTGLSSYFAEKASEET